MSASAGDFDFMGLQRKSFKDRPPHATMQGWDDDRMSKWAESEMGKRSGLPSSWPLYDKST